MNYIFWILFIAQPILFIGDFGNSYTEPKVICLLLISLLSIVRLLGDRSIDRWRGEGRYSEMWVRGLIAFLVVCSISFGSVSNWGLALQFLGLIISLSVIPIMVCCSSFSIRGFYIALLPVLAVLLYGAFAMIIYRIPVFSTYSPFGSAIGLKNSLSVFLAQCVPFLLIATHDSRSQNLRLHKVLPTISYLFLIATLWVIIANRTRSAWLMLILYLLIFVYLCFRNRALFQGLFTRYIVALCLASIL